MKKSYKELTQVLFFVTLLMTQASLAKRDQNESSGYLSNQNYNLNSQKYSTNSAHIQMVDADQPDEVFNLDFTFKTRGTEMLDDNVKGTVSATVLEFEFEWNVTNWIKAQFIGGYQFAMGNSAVIYGFESTPYTGPSVDESSFSVQTLPGLELSAGIVTTDFNPISSSFAGGGFAGFRQVYEIKKGSFVGSIKGFQVAPSSLNAANRALDDEKSPFLTIGNLNLGVENKNFKIMFGYTQFDFYGLTSASAGDSRYLGNTVIGDGNSIVFYKYKFRGQEIAARSEINFRLDDKLGISGNMTENDEADLNRNKGWMSKAYYEYNFGRYSVRPSVTRFRFEPDLIPAPFGQPGFGYLNRDGYSVELRGALKKYKLEGFVRHVTAKEVEPKAAQSDRTSLTVGLEVQYEIL